MWLRITSTWRIAADLAAYRIGQFPLSSSCSPRSGPTLRLIRPLKLRPTIGYFLPGQFTGSASRDGIDILSRLLAAPRTDVVIAVVATAISVLVGSPLGVLIALMESRRGRGSTILAEIAMRLVEVIQAFPVFVFAMVLVAVFGGTKLNIVAAIAFVNTPVFVRLVRSDVLTLVQRPFAEAARAVGNSELRVGFFVMFYPMRSPLCWFRCR